MGNTDKDEFYIAVARGNAAVVKQAIQQGVGIDDKDEFGETALHIASEKGHLEILKMLIDAGANLDITNKQGYSPAHIAVLSQQPAALKLLIEKGAEKDTKDSYGNSLLSNAVMGFTDDDAIIRELLNLGIDPTLPNHHGVAPIQLMKMPKNKDIVHLFEKWLPEKTEPRQPPAEVAPTPSEAPAKDYRKYPEEAKYLWKNFVPENGQADTVQGELIRAVEKLRWEAQENGNMNWDGGFETLADYIESTLCNSDALSDKAKTGLRQDIRRIKDFEHPVLEDGPYDRISDHIVEWYRKNKDPIPKAFNPDLDR